jgi:hypothetical protein
MDFDPDKYLASKAQEFDPDSYLSSKLVQPAQEGPSSLESLGRGALQGGTLGFGDEIYGGGSAAVDAVKKGTLSDFVKDYVAARDDVRKGNDAAKKAHPYLYGTGEVGGSILPTIATGTAIPALAGLGATAAVGHSNSSDPVELAKEAAIGGGAAALTGKAIETAAPYVKAGASKVGNYIADKLGAGAEDLASVHLGDGASREAARAALDSGSISAGGRVAGTANKLGQAIENSTEEGALEVIPGPFKNFPPKPGTRLFPEAGPGVGDLFAAKEAADKTASAVPSATSEMLDKGWQGTGVWSLAHGNPYPLLSYGAHALTKGRLASTGAVAMDAASSGIRSLLDSNLLTAPQVSRIAASPYADLLKKASLNGQHALAMTHYVLQQTDPKYQELLKQD